MDALVLPRMTRDILLVCLMHSKTPNASLSLTVEMWFGTNTEWAAVLVNVFELGGQERFLPHKRLGAVENIAEEICVYKYHD